MGVSPKSKAKNGEKEEEDERLNDGENNGQATHGARKHAWRTQATWVKIVMVYWKLESYLSVRVLLFIVLPKF